MVKIYGFGNALIDIEILVKESDLDFINVQKGKMRHITSEEKEVFLKKFKKNIVNEQAGGSVANSLFAASKHDADCHFSSSYGDDKNASFFFKNFNNLVNYSGKSSEKSTGVCLIFITPDGERSMTSCLDANEDLSSLCIDKKKLSESDILIFDSFSICTDGGFETIKKSIQIAKINNLEICFGISDSTLVKVNEKRLKWLFEQKLDYVIGNEDEINELKNIISLNAETIITTKGKQGASVNQMHVDAPDINPINTNGAGDALLGVFLACKDEGVKEALQKAVNYATKVCENYGPRESK